jgi:hypothetical protein
MKKLMAQEEAMVPNLFYNMKSALIPLMHDDTYDTMAAVTAMVTQAGQLVNYNSSRGGNNAATERVAGTKRARGGATAATAAVVDGQSSGGGGGAGAGTGSVVETEKAENEQEGNASGEDDEPPAKGACGTDGGYCPPCYELA